MNTPKRSLEARNGRSAHMAKVNPPSTTRRILGDPRGASLEIEVTIRNTAGRRERANSRRYAPSQGFRVCTLASCRSGCSVYSWLGGAPVPDRRMCDASWAWRGGYGRIAFGVGGGCLGL